MAYGIGGGVILVSWLFYSITHAFVWKKTRSKNDWLGEMWYDFWLK